MSVDVQIALDEDSNFTIPGNEQIQQWADLALRKAGYKEKQTAQMTVRIVTEKEITRLNSTYRKKNNATNVLSFPFVAPPGIPEDEAVNLLGDLAICASVVNREAEQQHKTVIEHWAHMVIHGTFHLLGYDHQDEQEANEMEAMEINALAELGFGNPYE